MTDEQLTNYIFLEDYDPSADIAIVLGVNRFWRAAEKAIELYKDKKVPKLLFTGGINRLITIHEGPVMGLYAKDKGIPETDILIEDRASNTLENILFSRQLIEESLGFEKTKTITIVCMNLHARRALMTAKKNLPNNIILKVAPYDLLGFNQKTWTTHEKGRPRVEEEYEKIQQYLTKGDLAEL